MKKRNCINYNNFCDNKKITNCAVENKKREENCIRPGVYVPKTEIIARNTTTIDSKQPAKVVSLIKNNKTYLDFYIPKGEHGNVDMIKAGNVETVDFDKNAEVTDRIENDTHYLDFKIPRGLTGESAEGEKINIDCAITVDFNEPARVEDDFKDNVHNLSFYIPRGAPYLNDKTIVAMQKNSNQAITNQKDLIEFEYAKDFANANLTNTEVEILVAGLYKIDFGAYLIVNDETELAIINSGESMAYSTLIFDVDNHFSSRSLVVMLQVNDKISLQVTKFTNNFNFEKDKTYAYLNITPVLY